MAQQQVTAPQVLRAKAERTLVMLTAYDAPSARWGEAAGVDILLVGDSLAMVVLGHETTLQVTLEEMLHHARAVSRTATRCLVVGDLPFGSYQASVTDAVAAGIRFVKEGGVQAVKLEGVWPDRVAALIKAGVPVMGHVGLTPQSVHRFGGYRVQGRRLEDADDLVSGALELEAAGCFAMVLEGIPTEVASVITSRLRIPTIGIGAGVGCDGQVLVLHDLLGMSLPPLPRFVASYAGLGEAAVAAIRSWAEDVRAGKVPTAEQSYHLAPGEASRWEHGSKEG